MIKKMKDRVIAIIKYFKSRQFKNKYTNIIVKTIVISIMWVIFLIPFWIYLLVRFIADPVGFWQELAIFAICACCMGWAQLPLLFIGGFATIFMIFEDV